MAELSSSKIIQSVAPTPQHICPASAAHYFGRCPNTGCIANIARHKNTPHGCFLQQPNKSLIDLGHLLHISTAEVKLRYQKGLTRAMNFVEMYQWLTRRREEKPPPHCARCGVPHPAGRQGDCLQVLRCQRRVRFIARVRGNYPMNLTPLAMTAEEFWAMVLAQNREKFKILPPRRLERANKLLARLRYLQIKEV